MAIQTVFKRYEYKYIITKQQKEKIIDEMSSYMVMDIRGKTTIRNIYYDTDTYQLIRKSIDGPIYKEKLRVRSYSQVKEDSLVFVELKKKYESIVYKRRVLVQEKEAMEWMKGNYRVNDIQISKEVDYFLDYYKTLHPTVFLSYEREAYYTKEPSDFRVTFDDTILCRQENISLQAPIYGTQILSDDLAVMEIKCSGGIPLWMVNILSKYRIHKTSFSKYGTAYKTMIYPKLGGLLYA